MSYTPARDELLNELKMQFDRLIDAKERLDNKANNMMTISGTIATILMGIGAFIAKSSSDVNFSWFVVIMSLFALGVSLLIASIALNVIAYRLRHQDYPIGTKEFFKNNKLQTGVVTQYSIAWKDIFQDMMIKMYLECIQVAEHNINYKGYYLTRSQICFFIGLLLVPIILFFIIGGLHTLPKIDS